MTLLFDQNLSHRFIAALRDLFPDALHVRELGMDQSDDLAIWEHPRIHDLVIVTHDADYSDWNKIRGAPPQIVWLRCGNASVDQVHLKIRHAADRILCMGKDPEVGVIEVW